MEFQGNLYITCKKAQWTLGTFNKEMSCAIFYTLYNLYGRSIMGTMDKQQLFYAILLIGTWRLHRVPQII